MGNELSSVKVWESINREYYAKEAFFEDVASDEFRKPYEKACKVVVSKIENINKLISKDIERAFVKDICSRVKTADSCYDKMLKKKCFPNVKYVRERLNDIAGVRAVCYFLDDVYKLADMLLEDADYECMKIKDYIKKPKASGYQSLHLIIKVPVEVENGQISIVKVEVQLRTQAMDFWSSIEHHFIYKVQGRDLSEYEEEFLKCSKSVQKIDKQMLKIRKKMQTAKKVV